MNINPVQNRANLYEKTIMTASLNEHKTNVDNVEGLQTGKDFIKALEVARGVSDIREDKVADIKERIKNGTYNVSAEDVARKILQRW